MDTLRYAFEERRLLENFIYQKNGGSGESEESIQLGSTVSHSGLKSNNAKLPKTSTADAELSYPKPSSACTKRTRTNFQSQISVCQVRGCKKDLSSSKDYYKRHKVCDIHSKTAVVVVSDVQQRFCQQCSRFHMLDQFDGDKRSCRKRLARHNKLRRKPQLLTHLGSAFLQPSTSMLFSKVRPDGIFSPQCYELAKHNALGTSKNKPPYEVSHLAVPVQFGFSLPKSALHLNGIVKQYPSSDFLKPPSSVQNLSPAINSTSALFLLSGLNTELEQYSRYVNGISSCH